MSEPTITLGGKTLSLVNGASVGNPTDDQPNPVFEMAGARSLGDINRDAPQPLLGGRLSPDGHTILFGPGNAGKGVLASSWVTNHVQDGGRVLILDFEDHPEEWARRIWGLGGQPMMSGPIRHVSPLTHGAPDWDLLHAVGREHRSTLVVIDSVAYAVPGKDPSLAETATAYSAVIQPFGSPVLSLAHMNRVGDMRYPFGSVFWHAGARVTWSLVPGANGESKLRNAKANNYEWQGEYVVTSEWLDDIPRAVYETRYMASVAERIEAVLATGPASLDDIVAGLAADGDEVKRNSVRQALRRGLLQTPKPWTVESEVWHLTEAVRLDIKADPDESPVT